MVTVNNSKDLGKAIKNGESTIIVEGDIVNGIIRIKATGKVAWGIAIACIGGAIALYLSTPATTAVTAPIGGAGGVVSFTGGAIATGSAITILGVSAVTLAIGVGIAAGGVGAVVALKDKYKIVEKSNNRLVLKKG